ncbi:hypothetical protein FOL47_006543 [Perkinsus chesapeaki]|uniref:Conserved oligomeric Golgi complex subunit 2 n=1 Tax=Perkinsus chesapeaki TaxID=330153 RepID=A0A7J6LR61_PERCH|nr:hypothetical protein FOL47_006543 [Perkinsus chesapeaki]
MGIASSISDRILFPAPASSYSCNLPQLVWHETAQGNNRPFLLIRGTSQRLPASLELPVIIYFHGNACDLGHIQFELEELARAIGGTVLGVEYPGYGVLNDGVNVPTAEGIQAAAEDAFDYVTSKWSVPPSNIFILGRSIGSGVASSLAYSLATKGIHVGGLILQSPYISIHDVVDDYMAIGRLVVNNEWDSGKCLASALLASTPLLILHGKLDEVINVRHSEALYGIASTPMKTLVLSELASHNHCDMYNDTIRPVSEFIAKYDRIVAFTWMAASADFLTSGWDTLEELMVVKQPPNKCFLETALPDCLIWRPVKDLPGVGVKRIEDKCIIAILASRTYHQDFRTREANYRDRWEEMARHLEDELIPSLILRKNPPRITQEWRSFILSNLLPRPQRSSFVPLPPLRRGPQPLVPRPLDVASRHVPLSEFTEPGADPVTIIQRYRRRGVPMTDLVKSFSRHENKLQEELVQLINDHYAEFIGLSTKMDDVSRKSASLRPPLAAALQSSNSSTAMVKVIVDKADELMKEKEQIGHEKRLLQLYIDNRSLLSKISDRLVESSSSADHLTLAGYAALENSAIELTRMELALREANTDEGTPSEPSQGEQFIQSLRGDLDATRDQLHKTLTREFNHLVKIFADAPSEDSSSVSAMCLLATCRGLVNLGRTDDIYTTIIEVLVDKQLNEIASSEKSGLTAANSASSVSLEGYFGRVSSTLKSQTHPLAKLNECLMEVEGLHLLPECLLRPALECIIQRVPSIFMPTYPVQFAANYSASQTFIRQLGEGHEKYLSTAPWVAEFEGKWKTNVYFSLRQREIAQQVRKELFTREDSPLQLIRSQIWCEPEALAQLMPQLVPRCLHLTCDVLAAWQGHIADKTAAEASNFGLLLSFCKDLSTVSSELAPETVDGLGAKIEATVDSGSDVAEKVEHLLYLCVERLHHQASDVETTLSQTLVAAVVPKLEGVKQIPVLYRMTSKSAPTTNSAYIDNACSILSDFSSKYNRD